MMKRFIPTNLDKKKEKGKKVVKRKIARQIDRIERWTDRGEGEAKVPIF